MEIFPISEAEKVKVHEYYGTNPKRIQEDVEIIQEWLKKQPHLPQKLQYENFVDKMLLNNKFNVEATKIKMDYYFTTKRLNLDCYEFVAREDLILPSKSVVPTYVMPKLGPSQERLIVQIIRNADPAAFEQEYFFYSILTTLELVMRYNYSNGIRFVFDLKNFTFDHTKKTDLARTSRAAKMILQGFSSRVLSIDFVNCKSYFYIILNASKAGLKRKIADRIKVHSNLETLHESIPKEYLPSELGGDAGSVFAFEDAWDTVYKDHHSFFKESKNYISDEKLRIGQSLYNEALGIDGTFRKLNVD